MCVTWLRVKGGGGWQPLLDKGEVMGSCINFMKNGLFWFPD